MNYISLGPDCHIAGALNLLKLRKEAFPFDFLLSESEKGLEYVSLLVQNNFVDFLDDLDYNLNFKVISKNYPYTQFIHHNLLKNKQTLVKSLKLDHINMEEPLIEKFKRRANRFMNIIVNPQEKCLFFYVLNINNITNNESLKKIIFTIDTFFETMNKFSKCNYRLIIFVKINVDNFVLIENIILEINKKYNNLIIFEPFFGSNNDKDNKLNIERCIEKYNF
jgi:hypothetical protein